MDFPPVRPRTSGEQPSPLGDTQELVRELLYEALQVQQGGHLPEAAVRRRTRAICDCARARGLPIERVLVALKEEWQGAREARALRRDDATRMLERIVTLCIGEYYADVPPH